MAYGSRSSVDLSQTFDVLVIGGGNAALCAAMTAREAGANVLLLECAPKDFRGGNSRHTRNLRYLHESGNEYLTGPYDEEEFWDDLMRVTEGQTTEKLARFTIRKSKDAGEWMEKHGCHFQPAMRGTLHLARTNAFFLGGGKALMNAYYATAGKLGVEILYEAEVRELEIRDGKFCAAIFMSQGSTQKVRAKTVVVASGGFEANLANKHATRFYDEGEDFWPKRYAIWGRLVAQQPDQIAYSIIDSKSMDLFIPSVFPPIEADSIEELAVKLQLDPTVLDETVTDFNQAIRAGTFDPAVLDDCRTQGLTPPKSHWARTLDTAPYYGYPLRPGITFTYLGITVNENAQVILQNGQPLANIFAAGEIMAGNILGKGYLAGFGMTIGTVFGRIAGKEAARYAFK
jgi:succinate dehydrogenase/fumarate reductase flavoprotein subunit